jgi:hypothetical protein
MAHSKTHVVTSKDKTVTVVSTITADVKRDGNKTTVTSTTKSLTIDTAGRWTR